MSFSSFLLVAAQFIWLALLAFTGEFFATSHLITLIIQAASILLGLWAILSVGRNQLRIQPEVHPDARLVMTGPYLLIRHPMYTSVLTFGAASVASDFSWLRLGIILALLATMISKLLYEECLLERHFDAYAEYRRTTWRIIPWIF